jgi:septum formation topological specificity factor MinE
VSTPLAPVAEQVQVTSVPLTSKTPRIGRLASILQASSSASTPKKENKLPPKAENILKVWQRYLEVESEKELSAFFINFFKLLVPEWKDGQILYFESDNNISLSSLEKCRLDIIQFIKERVEVEDIRIETRLVETTSDAPAAKVMVTMEEQLQEVRKTNPAIEALIQKLGLEL